MQLLLDMGISRDLAGILTGLGFPTKHLDDEGLGRLADPQILHKARQEQRVLVTHDLDFADLAAASGERLPSVILLRLRNMRPESVLLHLQKILSHCQEALEQGAFVTATESLIRVRSLPIGG